MPQVIWPIRTARTAPAWRPCWERWRSLRTTHGSRIAICGSIAGPGWSGIWGWSTWPWPLSPDELIKKRHAIYRHVSQKDIVPFPGSDSREFWQRAEERTQNTARLYDKLGMAEYQAIEVFVKMF